MIAAEQHIVDVCTCWMQSVRDASHRYLHASDCYLFPPSTPPGSTSRP